MTLVTSDICIRCGHLVPDGTIKGLCEECEGAPRRWRDTLGCLPSHPDGLSSEEEIARLRGRGEHSEVFEEIRRERNAQDRRWGAQEHDPFYWLSILGEEKGKACKAANEGQWDEYEAELILVAAVAVNAVECSRRNRNAEAGGE